MSDENEERRKTKGGRGKPGTVQVWAASFLCCEDKYSFHLFSTYGENAGSSLVVPSIIPGLVFRYSRLSSMVSQS